jgi:hypothetical protein
LWHAISGEEKVCAGIMNQEQANRFHRISNKMSKFIRSHFN